MHTLKVFHQKTTYGRVRTTASPSTESGGLIRVETAEFGDLAQLAADILGEAQPLLPVNHKENLLRWVVRFGCNRWGERPFLQAVARALIWRPLVVEV